jgi:hypothetical protein
VLEDIYQIATLVQCIQHPDDVYITELVNDDELDDLKNKLVEKVTVVMEECETYKDTYNQMSYLWTVSDHCSIPSSLV